MIGYERFSEGNRFRKPVVSQHSAKDLRDKLYYFLRKSVSSGWFLEASVKRQLKTRFGIIGHQADELCRLYSKINQFLLDDVDERRKIIFTDSGEPKHIIETRQFGKSEIELFVSLALSLKQAFQEPQTTNSRTKNTVNEIGKLLQEKILYNIFLQYSTRTQGSFEAAALRLGAKVISEKDPSLTSTLSRHESLADTIRTSSYYADVIVLRTPWDYSAHEAMFALKDINHEVPIINAGSGSREHPTQGLLDLVTIKEKLFISSFSELNNKTILILGTKFVRTTKSLLQLLLTVAPKMRVTFVAPYKADVNDKFGDFMKSLKTDWSFSKTLDEITSADVVYLARVDSDIPQVQRKYTLSDSHKHLLRADSVILHPLPRVNEMEGEIDRSLNNTIWNQVENGVYLRSVLLTAVLEKLKELQDILGVKQTL